MEYMALMAAASGAMIFSPWKEQLEVAFGFNVAGYHIVETGPSGSAVIFVFRWKQSQFACGAHINTAASFMIQRAAEWPLGPLFSKYVILLRGQQLFPLRVRPDYFLDGPVRYVRNCTSKLGQNKQAAASQSPSEKVSPFHGLHLNQGTIRLTLFIAAKIILDMAMGKA
jgi:hypothetical protein